MELDKQVVWDILNTDRNEDFKEYRRRHRMTWLTKEREILLMANMETSHIISCINMLEALDQQYTLAYGGLIEELRKRGVAREDHDAGV
jgi:hypothetical protein